MADRARQDFVKVRARAGCGAVNIVSGNFTLKLAAGETAEVTRAEWNAIYRDLGALELVEDNPQISPIAQRGRKPEKESEKSA